MNDHELIAQLNIELKRLKAHDAQVKIDHDFDPNVETLVELQVGAAYWHFLPGSLLPLLRDLPDGVGSETIKQTIEKNATTVWHGPAPEGSRDTSA